MQNLYNEAYSHGYADGEKAAKELIESMRQQLAEAHKETDSVVYARDEAYRMLDECERERDMYKGLYESAHEIRADAEIEAMKAEEQLATVTAERDELVEFANDVRRSGDTRLASMAIATLAKLGADKGEK